LANLILFCLTTAGAAGSAVTEAPEISRIAAAAQNPQHSPTSIPMSSHPVAAPMPAPMSVYTPIRTTTPWAMPMRRRRGALGRWRTGGTRGRGATGSAGDEGNPMSVDGAGGESDGAADELARISTRASCPDLIDFSQAACSIARRAATGGGV
jgi:hypothetical protein